MGLSTMTLSMSMVHRSVVDVGSCFTLLLLLLLWCVLLLLEHLVGHVPILPFVMHSRQLAVILATTVAADAPAGAALLFVRPLPSALELCHAYAMRIFKKKQWQGA